MFAEKVMESSSITGTGSYTLGTSVGVYNTWRSKFATLAPVFYFATNADGSKWEAGYGTLTYGAPDTISRNVLDSYTGAAVSWAVADAPVYVYNCPNGRALAHLIAGGVAAALPAWLPDGGIWTSSADGIAVRLKENLKHGAVLAERGRYEALPGIWVASPRSYWLNNGAANLAQTIHDVGKIIKFDTTAAGRTYTLLAGATAGIGHGFRVGIFPYGGNNAVGIVPNGTEVIDGGLASATMYVPPNRVTWLYWDGHSLQWRTDLSGASIDNPDGRLTLETGVPVSSTDQAGKTVIYYSPIGGVGQLPLRAGAGFAMFPFAQLSNDTTQSATGSAGPAVLGPYQCVDLYAWLNGGVPTLTRNLKWLKTATITMTIATPGVVTHTGHGLWDGATVRFTTTGALPTGITASTDYFLTVIDANSYKLSTTLANQIAGTFIATTGSQSGVHTGQNYTSTRGTGAGTPEQANVNGVVVNAIAITNGPAIGQGTYLGTIYGNGSSQMDLKFGSSASGGGEAIIGIWNAYNRLDVKGVVQDSAAAWAYSTAAWKCVNASATNRVTVVSGAAGDFLSALSRWGFYDGSGGLGTAQMTVGMNTIQTPVKHTAGITDSTTTISVQEVEGEAVAQPVGLAYGASLAYTSASGGAAYQSTGASGSQAGMHYSWRY